ncbi:MAG: helix-turn-helix domain-containing protein, partial [Phycisphaeraceae bacterium]|nr:helix-turn-helix domain-containing protein [Phycisphaeraceae bacterium]
MTTTTLQGRNSQTAPLSRSLILDTTEQCMRRWGYDQTTIRRIAGEIGCAVGSIYRYFGDKRELLLAVGQRRLEPAVKRAEAGDGLLESARVYHQHASANPGLYRLTFWIAGIEGR